MAEKTNLQKAKRLETNFWIICTCNLAILLFYAIYQPPNTEFVFVLPLIWVAGMGVCVFQTFRALKQEIADLNSGDSDTASVTASTDPPAEGSPTPEGD